MRVLRYAMADTLGSSKNISHVHLQDVESLLAKQCGTSVKTAGGLVVYRQYDRMIFKKITLYLYYTVANLSLL